MKKVCYMMCLMIPLFLYAQQDDKVEYDLRISYTGDKNAPTTIRTHYCKGTTTKCGKQTKTSFQGVLLFSAFYTNGAYDGKVLSYYSNGTLKESRTYIQGKEEGKRVLYYENGKIQSEQEYVLGKREGEGKKYYENGILQAQFFYKDDRLDGIRIEYNKQGILTYETLYQDGKKKTMKHYDAKGAVLKEQNCRWEACY